MYHAKPLETATPQGDNVLSVTILGRKYKAKAILVLMVIVAIGIFLRFYKLDFQSLWYDEIHSMNGSDPDQSIREVIEYSRTDQPPFFFLLLHFWLKLFSFTDLAGRAFSAVAGCLGIVAMYFLGREIKDENTGIISALLTAVNYFHVSYSQEVRFYSLLFLITQLSFLYFIRSLKQPKGKNFIGYILFTTLTVYTHYYGLVVLASQGLIFLFLLIARKGSSRLFIYGVASGTAICILILPWVPQIVSDASSPFWIEQVSFPKFLPAYFYNYFRDATLFYAFSLLGLYFIIHHIRLRIKQAEKLPLPVLILILWIILGYGIPYFYSIIKAPMMIVRYTIVVLPAILITLSLALTSIASRWRFFAIITLTLLSIRTLFFVQDYYSTIRKEQWREVAEEVIKENRVSVVIFSYYAWHYNYYFKSKKSRYRVIHPSSVNYEEAIRTVDYIWLLQGHENNIGASREELALIERHFRRIKEFILLGARGTLYQKKE